MLCDPSLFSGRPGDESECGSFLEESSGGGDSSGILGGDSPVTGPLGAVLLIVFLTGMVGNICTVVVASGRGAGGSAGSLGVYVINLDLADLLYLSPSPFVVCTYFAHDWFFGDVGCRLLLSPDLLAMHTSIFLLIAMSLESYGAVARQLHARRASNTYRKLASAVLLSADNPHDGDDSAVAGGRLPTWGICSLQSYLTVLFVTSILAPGAVLGIVYSCLARAYRASAWGLGMRATGRPPAQRLSSRISASVVADWACFLPFWAWQLAKLYRGEGLAISPASWAYLNFGVTCPAYGDSCAKPFLCTLLAGSCCYRRPGHSSVGTARPPRPSQEAVGGPGGEHSTPLPSGELSGPVGESEV